MSKLYVVVRSDLKRSSMAAQACHAVAEWAKDEDWHRLWYNETIVLLKVPNIQVLEEYSKKVLWEISARFCEPDLGGSLTAFAVLANKKVDQILSDLPLM
jgi:peptidyl-tRNA hydrolase